MANTDFEAIHVRKTMRTRKLIERCRKLAGPDEYGRRVPGYLIVHRALTELLARLKGGTADDTGEPTEKR